MNIQTFLIHTIKTFVFSGSLWISRARCRNSRVKLVYKGNNWVGACSRGTFWFLAKNILLPVSGSRLFEGSPYCLPIRILLFFRNQVFRSWFHNILTNSLPFSKHAPSLQKSIAWNSGTDSRKIESIAPRALSNKK